MSTADVKRVFLTGASSGIGLATAHALSAAGHQIWGTSRELARLPALPGFRGVLLDLAAAESIASGFAPAESEAGGFDVLINNAGAGHFGAIESVSPEILARDFQVLVFGQIQLMQLALGGMRSRNRGLVINVSSLASRLPVPYMATYNAAKAALALFTMSLNLELQHTGVRVVDLQPGDIRTRFNDAVMKLPDRESPDAARVARTWRVVEQNMAKAPPPELVAQRIVRLLEVDNPPPRITVGDVFQARVAPFLLRLLPMRTQLWGIRNYYGL